MSSLLTIAGTDGEPLDVSEARLVYPLTGAWHADLFIASPNDLTGAVTINIADTLTLHGTVIDGGTYVEALHVRVLAGAGGWNQPCSPKYYQGATLGFILSDILSGAGEQLSATSDAGARNVLLVAFATTSGTVGANVRALMAYAAQWTGYRFLADGSFWIGPETWPAFTEDYTVTTENPTERRLDVGAQIPTLYAGQSVVRQDGSIAQLSRVEWAISVSAIRARGWWNA